MEDGRDCRKSSPNGYLGYRRFWERAKRQQGGGGRTSKRDWVRTIALVGEGVEGLDREPADPRLEAEEADRRRGPSGWSGRIGGRGRRGGVEGQLVAEVAEDLRVDPLDLEAGLVLDRARPAAAPRARSWRTGEWNRRPGSGRGRLGAGQDLGQAGGPDRQRIACPPSMIRTSPARLPAMRRWPRTANQSGCSARPKTWKARSATRDRPKLTPIRRPLSWKRSSRKSGMFRRARDPETIIERRPPHSKPSPAEIPPRSASPRGYA